MGQVCYVIYGEVKWEFQLDRMESGHGLRDFFIII